MGKPGGGPPSPFARGAKAAPCGRWRGIAPREGGQAGQGRSNRCELYTEIYALLCAKGRKWRRWVKSRKKLEKGLQTGRGCGIIIERDCMRYAMKREVAAHCGRFFRGVCPILNRAKEFEELEPPCVPGRPMLCPSKDVWVLTLSPGSALRGLPVFLCPGWKHPELW